MNSNVIVIIMQKDLSGLASCLSSSRSPVDVPKTIVFASTKNSVCRVYRMLSGHASKKLVGMFHASMAASTKAVCVSGFRSGRTRCLVSTIAFGMVCYTKCIHMCVCMYMTNCI